MRLVTIFSYNVTKVNFLNMSIFEYLTEIRTLLLLNASSSDYEIAKRFRILAL